MNKFKIGDRVRIKSLSNTTIQWGHNQDMLNVGDEFVINHFVEQETEVMHRDYSYHVYDLELVVPRKTLTKENIYDIAYHAYALDLIMDVKDIAHWKKNGIRQVVDKLIDKHTNQIEL